MKRFTSVLSSLTIALVLASLCTIETSAQVSVRRTPRKETPPEKSAASPTPSPVKAAADKKAATAKANAATKQTQQNNTTAVRRNAAEKKASTASTVSPDGTTLRSQAFDEYQRQDLTDTPWQRVIYRELDVMQGSNASLYYPQDPVDGLTNMFRLVFDLMITGKVKGYEYQDGREVFSDKYIVNIKDLLDRFQVIYVEKPAVGKNPASFTVEESDVPCGDVLSYFVKERWEFDPATSHYGPRIIAVCPVVHRSGDFGGDAVKYPMCWLRYEDLRPYLRQNLIMSDGMNNAPRYTLEDFFAMHQYSGDIYKVQNLRGLSLMQQYPNPDSLALARKRIESELTGFGDSIWVNEAASAPAVATKKAVAPSASDSTTAVTTATDKKNRRTKQPVDVAEANAKQAAKDEVIDKRVERTGTAHSVRRSR